MGDRIIKHETCPTEHVPLGLQRVRGNLIYTWMILNGMLAEDVRGYFLTVSDFSTLEDRWKLFKQETEA